MSLLSLLLWHITSGYNKQGWSVYRREENIDDAEPWQAESIDRGLR